MNDRQRRKILWWNMPVDPEQSARIGGGMMRAIVIWFVVVVALVVLVVAIRAIV